MANVFNPCISKSNRTSYGFLRVLISQEVEYNCSRNVKELYYKILKTVPKYK